MHQNTQHIIDLAPDIPTDDWPSIWHALFNATFESTMAASEIAQALKTQWSQTDIDELIAQLEK